MKSSTLPRRMDSNGAPLNHPERNSSMPKTDPSSSRRSSITCARAGSMAASVTSALLVRSYLEASCNHARQNFFSVTFKDSNVGRLLECNFSSAVWHLNSLPTHSMRLYCETEAIQMLITAHPTIDKLTANNILDVGLRT